MYVLLERLGCFVEMKGREGCEPASVALVDAYMCGGTCIVICPRYMCYEYHLWQNSGTHLIRVVICYTRGKSLCKTSLQVGMDLYKVQKQSRDVKYP